jgi:two-component system response regulator PilR (NtrC family)
LENIIERGVAMESSNIILPDNLILSTHSRKKRGMAVTLASGEQKSDTEHKAAMFVAARDEEELFERGLEAVLEDVERSLILHALTKADNSKTKAAKLLKLGFRSLRYRTKKLGID